MIRQAFSAFSHRSREHRAAILRRYVDVDPAWRILDLGGGTGDHIHQVLPGHRNIVVADFLEEDLAVARQQYGYETVQVDGTEELPFSDREFDFVFCSSVIEHVTGPKDEMLVISDGAKFRKAALACQEQFAVETRRIAARYFVQTPHKYFPVESHSWLPVPIVLLPRRAQMSVLRLVDRSGVWPKQTDPDWNLLVTSDMQRMFPDGEVIVEQTFGFPKSIMAIKA